MIETKLLKGISKSDHKVNLVKYLEQVKDELADIRKGSYTNETRKAAIDIIDKLLLDKLRINSQTVDKEIDDYH